MAILKDTVINGDLRVNGRMTPAAGIYFGICETAAATQDKVATIPGITEYYDGLLVRILFTNKQTYNGIPYLNINGLGRWPVRYKSGGNMGRYFWNSGSVLDFVFHNGDGWIASSRDLASTTYYGMVRLTQDQGVDYALTPNQYFVSKKIIKCATAFSIPAEGTSVTKKLDLITAEHELARWNFSSSPENQPPCDLSYTTTAGSFTITNNGGTSSETIQPSLIWTFSRAITDPT